MNEMQLTETSQNQARSFLDITLLLACRTRLIASVAVAGGLIAGALTFLMTPRYSATAVIMPPQQPQSAASALLGQLAPIAAVAGRDLGLKNPGDVYLGVLQSRTIADALVKQFSLQAVYSKTTATAARSTLADRTKLRSGQDSLIRVTVQDTDPKRAAAIANAYIEQLERQNSRLAVTESAQRRAFFERQVESERSLLNAAEDALKETQVSTGLMQLGSQIEANLRAIAQLQAEITGREVNLQRLATGATEQNPELVRQRAELTALRERLRRLSTGTSQNPDPMLPTSQLPKAGLEYVRKLRDVKYHESLLELLTKQFAAARLDEAKEAPIIQVVDPAVPPETRSWPPRALIAVSGGLVIGLIACMYCLATADPANERKLRLVGTGLVGRLKFR